MYNVGACGVCVCVCARVHVRAFKCCVCSKKGGVRGEEGGRVYSAKLYVIHPCGKVCA